jgi:hypothetical protein
LFVSADSKNRLDAAPKTRLWLQRRAASKPLGFCGVIQYKIAEEQHILEPDPSRQRGCLSVWQLQEIRERAIAKRKKLQGKRDRQREIKS